MSLSIRLLACLCIVVASIPLKAQKGMEAFRKGYESHQQGAYRQALDHYGKAIELNDSLKKAYYNRASVRIALQRFEKAKEDLERTLSLDPDYVPAYYNRANIFTREGRYKRAHEDLNTLLRKKDDHRKALLLRGQVRQQLGMSEAGCQDLQRAKRLGAQKANEHIRKFCDRKAPLDLESRWPEMEDWTVVHRNDGKHQKRIQLVPKNESFPEWDHLGSLSALKNIRGIPMDTARYLLKRQAKGKCKEASTRTLEKNDGKNAYIFFILTCSDHINTQEPETQLWYVEQGERHLYAYFVALRQKGFSEEQKRKWQTFFRK